jgi:predicted membrane metal-binding protein
MIALFWIAFRIRPPMNPLASFSASALIVLLVRLWQLFDVSFQFSYTVVFSIILYGIPLAYLQHRKYPYVCELGYTLFTQLQKNEEPISTSPPSTNAVSNRTCLFL